MVVASIYEKIFVVVIDETVLVLVNNACVTLIAAIEFVSMNLSNYVVITFYRFNQTFELQLQDGKNIPFYFDMCCVM